MALHVDHLRAMGFQPWLLKSELDSVVEFGADETAMSTPPPSVVDAEAAKRSGLDVLDQLSKSLRSPAKIVKSQPLSNQNLSSETADLSVPSTAAADAVGDPIATVQQQPKAALRSESAPAVMKTAAAPLAVVRWRRRELAENFLGLRMRLIQQGGSKDWVVLERKVEDQAVFVKILKAAQLGDSSVYLLDPTAVVFDPMADGLKRILLLAHPDAAPVESLMHLRGVATKVGTAQAMISLHPDYMQQDRDGRRSLLWDDLQRFSRLNA